MSVRETAKAWMKKNYPNELNGVLRVSKYYPEQDIWFFTFPTSFFDKTKSGHIAMLLQSEKDSNQFHYIKVPFDFLRKNQTKFDIRSSADKFDLHVSAKQRNWLIDERSKGVGFTEFEQPA
jgi:hypothetical protein